MGKISLQSWINAYSIDESVKKFEADQGPKKWLTAEFKKARQKVMHWNPVYKNIIGLGVDYELEIYNPAPDISGSVRSANQLKSFREELASDSLQQLTISIIGTLNLVRFNLDDKKLVNMIIRDKNV